MKNKKVYKYMKYQTGKSLDRRSSTWEKTFRILESYYNYNGTIVAPVDFKTNDGITYSEYGVSLRKWTNAQIKKFNEGKLTPNQMELFRTLLRRGLDDVSIKVDNPNTKWFEENDDIALEQSNCLIDAKKFKQYKKGII